MPKHVPERTCIVTRDAHPQGELMRFALAPDGTVVPDLKARLPGRGAWVTPRADVLALAVRKKAFSRAFKAEARAAPTLVADTDALLVRDLVGALALANKAGAVVTGFGKVESLLAGPDAPAALLHAREAAPDGRRKLAALLRRAAGRTISPVPTFDDLGGDDLDVATGRVGVIHAALLAGAGSAGCLARWRRLRLFRGLDGESAVSRDVASRSDETTGADGQVEAE